MAVPHADAEDIAAAVRGRLGRASTQGVYDALRVLTEQGLVRRIDKSLRVYSVEDPAGLQAALAEVFK